MSKICHLVLCLQIVMSLSAPLQSQEQMKKEKNLPILPTEEKEAQVIQMQEKISTLKPEEKLQQVDPGVSSKNTLKYDSLEPVKNVITKEIESQISDKKSRQMFFPVMQMPMVNPQIQYRMSLPIPLVQGNQPMLSPMEGESLQQQMMALQQIQAMQNMQTVHAPSSLYLPQAEQMLLLLPSSVEDMNTQEESKKQDETNDNTGSKLKGNVENGFVDEELDSVILEANPEIKNKRINTKKGFRKAVLLVPGGRFSIGGFISSIPWLPFEVNVPDTISWAYNGIANGIGSIISIIGQRWPFKRPGNAPVIVPVATEDGQVNMKMFFKEIQNNEEVIQSPVVVLPVEEVMPVRRNGPMAPMFMAPGLGNMPLYPQMIPGQV